MHCPLLLLLIVYSGKLTKIAVPSEKFLSLLVDLLYRDIHHLFPQVGVLFNLLLGTVYSHGKVGAVHL